MLDKVLANPKHKPLDDSWDRHLAERAADRIREFWYEQGYLGIETEVIYSPGGFKNGKWFQPAWGIRSNIGPNGYPPRI